jgi:hypothetical protein
MIDIFDRIESAKRAADLKRGEAWYRGHSRSNWKLIPKILRFKHTERYIHRIENELYAGFRSDSAKYIDLKNREYLGSWDYLAAMQHYGISTRYLDWSTNVEVALYFALRGITKIDVRDRESWPCIWVVNPYRLNKLWCDDRVIFDKADKVPFDYYEQTIDSIKNEAAWPHETPIAISPGYSNDRIQSQHGRFTFHGKRGNCLFEQMESKPEFWYIKKVEIRPEDIVELRKSRLYSAEKHLSLFPDIEGYVAYLNHKAKVF